MLNDFNDLYRNMGIEYFKFEKLEEIRVDYDGVSLLFYIPQLNDYIKEKRV